MSDEEKLALMLEYMTETGKKIVHGTQYKGYNLGVMKNNLRMAYFSGKLHMDDELLQKFMDAGIILPQKERIRTSAQEKYDFIVSLYNEYHGDIKEILADETQMKNGMKYKDALESLQYEYNSGKLNLDESQIQFLKKEGLLTYSKQEKLESIKRAKECGLPVKAMEYAEKNYQSIDEFLQAIKQGKDQLPSGVDFEGFKGLAISSKDISVEQKLRYAQLICAMFSIDIDDISYKTGKYIDIDRVEQLLSKLDDRTLEVVKKNHGIGGNIVSRKEIAESYNLSENRIMQILRSGLRIMRALSLRDSPIHSVSDIDLSTGDLRIAELDIELKALKKIRSLAFDENGNLNGKLTVDELKENEVPEKYILELIRYANEPYKKTGTKRLQPSSEKTDAEETIISEGFQAKVLREKFESITTEDLNFSSRIYNVLKHANIGNALDFLNIGNYEELLKIKNLGVKGAEEVVEKLKEIGITTVEDNNGEKHFEIATNQPTKEKPSVVSLYDERISNLINERQKIISASERKKKQREAYDKLSNVYLQDEDIYNPSSIVPNVSQKEQGILRLHSFEELLEHDELFDGDNKADENKTEGQRIRELIDSIKNKQKEIDDLKAELEELKKRENIISASLGNPSEDPLDHD